MGDLERLSELIPMQAQREKQVLDYTAHVAKRLRALGIAEFVHTRDKTTTWHVYIDKKGRLLRIHHGETKQKFLPVDECAEVMSDLHKSMKAMRASGEQRQTKLDQALNTLAETKRGMDRDELG
jgi:hypothetical protein